MKSKLRNKGTVLVLGEEGRKRMMRILKRMKEETKALERLMKMKDKEETRWTEK